jgi:hypothetical protein
VISTFKKNIPTGNFYLLIYALFLKLPLFLGYNKVQLLQSDGILYKKILIALNTIASNTSPLFGVISFILLYSQAIFLNKIVNEQKLLKQNSYLTGMTYLLITSLFTDWFSLSAPLFANSAILWAYAKACTIHNNTNPKRILFNIGLLLGISSFIYFPSISFVLFIIFAIAISRTFKIKEWLLVILGIVTPLYLFSSYLYLTNQISSYHFPGFSLSIPIANQNTLTNISLGLIVIATLIGLYYINKNFNRQVVQTRKSWQIIFLYALVAVIVPFINSNVNFSFWILLAVPLAPIISAAFFYPNKKWPVAILHYAMIAIYIALNFYKK